MLHAPPSHSTLLGKDRQTDVERHMDDHQSSCPASLLCSETHGAGISPTAQPQKSLQEQERLGRAGSLFLF